MNPRDAQVPIYSLTVSLPKRLIVLHPSPRMRLLLALTAVLLTVCKCSAQGPKKVFAHFMVGNTAKFTSSDWDKQINDAANSGIDGFALNMAWDWEHNADALELAFAAAAKRSGFVMIFSFDYAGNGPWELDAVVEYILKYREHRSYWNHIPGRPLVSTFEGPDHADDWIEIKDRTNCFFMPDWSSQGAEPALALGNHVADGLFSWAAWPWGDRDIDTFTDVAYQRALAAAGNKPYMMPVSPWFFTNLPGYHKNWLWTGGKTGGLMWFQRWQQIWDLKPEYVQIISWNDYGESHHIADPDPKQYEEWTAVGKPPMDYVTNHGAWRLALPFLIEMYKKGTAGVDRESVVVWSHQTYSKACENGGTTGNTASQLQLEMDPSQSSPDYFYVAAVLKAPYTFQGWSGGVTWEDSQYYVGEDDWLFKPWGGVGLYYTAVKMRHPGRQSLALSREVNHEYFSWEFEETCYKDEPVNWNAQVQGASWEYRDTNGWGIEGTKYPQLNTSSQQCIGGWSVDGFDDICSFTCSKDYCPPGACVCNKWGLVGKLPMWKGINVWPKNGDPNYGGLCTVACNYGFEGCDKYCSTTVVPEKIPASSPFTPNTCTAGTASGQYKQLCEYACAFGFCPRNTCTCTKTGPLVLPPPVTVPSYTRDRFDALDDNGLCQFACSRKYCVDPCGSKIRPRWEVSDEELQQAKDDYPGIWWETAAKTCTTERFRKLVNTLSEALWLADAKGPMDETIVMDSKGWEEFMGPSQWWDQELGDPDDYEQLISLWPKVINFVNTSPRRDRRQYKIMLYCGDPEGYERCATSEKTGRRVPAYVPAKVNPSDPNEQLKYDNCPNCAGIGFCNLFFDLPDMSTQLSGSQMLEQTARYEPTLTSKAHAMLHELFHNDIIGFAEHITDVQYTKDGFKKNAYGWHNSNEFAYLYQDQLKINREVLHNADSLAWVRSYNAYEAAWGWRVMKKRELESGEKINHQGRDMAALFHQDFAKANKDKLAEFKGTAGEFTSKAGCTLTLECRLFKKNGYVPPQCTCTCAGIKTALTDERCIWFLGPDKTAIQPGQPLPNATSPLGKNATGLLGNETIPLVKRDSSIGDRESRRSSRTEHLRKHVGNRIRD